MPDRVGVARPQVCLISLSPKPRVSLYSARPHGWQPRRGTGMQCHCVQTQRLLRGGTRNECAQSPPTNPTRQLAARPHTLGTRDPRSLGPARGVHRPGGTSRKSTAQAGGWALNAPCGGTALVSGASSELAGSSARHVSRWVRGLETCGPCRTDVERSARVGGAAGRAACDARAGVARDTRGLQAANLFMVDCGA